MMLISLVSWTQRRCQLVLKYYSLQNWAVDSPEMQSVKQTEEYAITTQQKISRNMSELKAKLSEQVASPEISESRSQMLQRITQEMET
jgi:hypothetical protein